MSSARPAGPWVTAAFRAPEDACTALPRTPCVAEGAVSLTYLVLPGHVEALLKLTHLLADVRARARQGGVASAHCPALEAWQRRPAQG